MLKSWKICFCDSAQYNFPTDYLKYALFPSLTVLISEGCHNKLPHTWDLENNRNLFSPSSVHYKSKIKLSAGLHSI